MKQLRPIYDPSVGIERLRKKTEELIRRQPPAGSQKDSEILELINELGAYQTGLVSQNQALKVVEQELYDLHPVGI